MNYIPQFKELKFKSDKQLDEFLSTKTFAALYLTGKGFDLQKIWVHKSGEILNTDFNGDIYIGKFINIDKLKLDVPLEIFDNVKQCFVEYSNLIPEDIIY